MFLSKWFNLCKQKMKDYYNIKNYNYKDLIVFSSISITGNILTLLFIGYYVGEIPEELLSFPTLVLNQLVVCGIALSFYPPYKDFFKTIINDIYRIRAEGVNLNVEHEQLEKALQDFDSSPKTPLLTPLFAQQQQQGSHLNTTVIQPTTQLEIQLRKRNK